MMNRGREPKNPGHSLGLAIAREHGCLTQGCLTRGYSCHHPEGSQAAATETVTSCHTPPLTFRPFPVACPGAWSPT